MHVTCPTWALARPYAGETLFTSPTELFADSGEQRQVRLDAAKGLSLVGPFAGYALRTTSDTVAFTASDQVLQLQAVQEMTVRAAGAMPQEGPSGSWRWRVGSLGVVGMVCGSQWVQENQCSNEQKLQISMTQDQALLDAYRNL